MHTYQAASQHYLSFCTAYDLQQFPLSENKLCPFTVMLVYQGLSFQTLITYLSATKHMHTLLGYPPLGLMPRLRLVLNGVHRLQPTLRKSTPRNRFPITPAILGQLRIMWNLHPDQAFASALWAAAALCFFVFF